MGILLIILHIVKPALMTISVIKLVMHDTTSLTNWLCKVYMYETNINCFLQISILDYIVREALYVLIVGYLVIYISIYIYI